MRPRDWRIALLFWVSFLAPLAAQESFFDSEGVRIRFVQGGKGDPVVLIHGLGSNLDVWSTSGVWQDLERSYHVVALDLRGHGQSDKPHDPSAYGAQMGEDVIRLLDHLGIQRAHIVGYSLGAHVTTKLIATHPDRFVSATLLSAAGRYDWSPDVQDVIDVQAAEIERNCTSRTLALRLAPADQVPTEQALAASAAACAVNTGYDRLAIAAVVRSVSDLVVDREVLAKLRVPLMGIVGDRDPYGLELLYDLRKIRPDLPLLLVPGATHNGAAAAVRRAEVRLALHGRFAQQ